MACVNWGELYGAAALGIKDAMGEVRDSGFANESLIAIHRSSSEDLARNDWRRGGAVNIVSFLASGGILLASAGCCCVGITTGIEVVYGNGSILVDRSTPRVPSCGAGDLGAEGFGFWERKSFIWTAISIVSR